MNTPVITTTPEKKSPEAITAGNHIKFESHFPSQTAKCSSDST